MADLDFSQLWDDVLYPNFWASVRGDIYGVISRDSMDETMFHLARRAISAFKFPKISTSYSVFYAIRDKNNEDILEIVEEGTIPEADEDGFIPQVIPHGCFDMELTYDEIEIILAWMKVYWCEQLLSNADNFEDIYTDNNIKTFSRANLVDKNLKLLSTYREYARELETRYSRTTIDRKPSLGDIN